MRSFPVVARLKAPDGYIGVWVNIYKRGENFYAGGAYKRRIDADIIAKSYRYDCIFVFVPILVKP